MCRLFVARDGSVATVLEAWEVAQVASGGQFPTAPFRMDYVAEEVRISDLAGTRGEIVDHRFIACKIIGPAVIYAEWTIFAGCHFGGSHEAVLWPVEGRSTITGAIALQDCIFEGCQFDMIGMAGSDRFIEAMRSVESDDDQEKDDAVKRSITDDRETS